MIKNALMMPIAVCVVLTAGCATLVSGSKQDVAFSSTPAGAKVFVDDENMGQTPLTLTLARKKEHQVRIEIPGYQPYLLKFDRNVNLWTVGNIFNFTGFIGLAIDYASGALFWLDPDQVKKSLALADADIGKQDGKLRVMVVMHADSGWKKIGQLQR
jgi:uncharacterized protein YceK